MVCMQQIFKKSEIKRDIENRGIDFKKWSEEILQTKRLAIIDKKKPYFDQWELNVLNDAYVEFLRKSAKNQKGELQNEEKGGGI